MSEVQSQVPAHVQRMITEQIELHNRVTKLQEFVVGDIYKTLPEDEQSMLSEQALAMSLYLMILTRRITKEKAKAAIQS